MTLGSDGNPLPAAGLVDIGLGEILLEHDLLEEARGYLERGCQATRSTWFVGSLDGMISMARVLQALGDVPGSQATLAEAARIALRTDSSLWDDAFVSAAAVRLALQRDDLAEAKLWWKRGGFPELNQAIALENYAYPFFEYFQLTRASFLLVKGQASGSRADLEQAAALLAALLLEAERFGRVTSQLHILVLQAMAQFALGDERAVKTLLHALELGEPEGFRRVYLDQGWRLAALLGRCREAQEQSGSLLPSLTYLDSLLESIQRAGPAPQPDQRPAEPQAALAAARLEDGLPVSLSPREVEVLTLIAEGKSNQEISAQLYLALNTVKRHAYNIYSKLEVKNRTQAVSKARQLELIP